MGDAGRVMGVMPRRVMRAVAAAAGLALCLTGCGSKESFGIGEVRLAAHALVEAAGERMVDGRAPFAPVSTSFDGAEVGLRVERPAGAPISLHSKDHAITEPLNVGRSGYRFPAGSRKDISIEKPFARIPLPPSPIAGHRLRAWTLFDHSAQSSAIAGVTVSWDADDPTDYVAGGFWMHLRGDARASIAGAAMGAFLEGPEFAPGPRRLPRLGTAKYRGHASGMYTFYYGPAWAYIPFPPGLELPVNGTREHGVYTGIVELTADFSANTISGCIGCVLPGEPADLIILETAGNTVEPAGDEDRLYAVYQNSEEKSFARIELGATPIDPARGAFAGENLNVVIKYFADEHTTSSGTWTGQFSRRTLADGTPRAVGATHAAKWRHPSGGRAVFLGSFLAGRR